MNLRIKSTKVTLKIIAYLQLVGGLTGIYLMFYLMLKTGTITGGILFIIFSGLGLFSYSLYVGRRLLFDEVKHNAIILSIINQILQLVQLGMFGFGLSYSSGAELLIGIQEQELTFNIAVLVSTFKISINSGSEFFVNLNLVAILLLFVLIDILKELKIPIFEEELNQPHEIQESNEHTEH